MKAKDFIDDCTKRCSNEYCLNAHGISACHPWLTPDEALRAVEIAREEVRKQMLEDAIKGIAYPQYLEIWANLDSLHLNEGDKVRIYVFKED
jgi:hypothetical protein